MILPCTMWLRVLGLYVKCFLSCLHSLTGICRLTESVRPLPTTVGILGPVGPCSSYGTMTGLDRPAFNRHMINSMVYSTYTFAKCWVLDTNAGQLKVKVGPVLVLLPYFSILSLILCFTMENWQFLAAMSSSRSDLSLNHMKYVFGGQFI